MLIFLVVCNAIAILAYLFAPETISPFYIGHEMALTMFDSVGNLFNTICFFLGLFWLFGMLSSR